MTGVPALDAILIFTLVCGALALGLWCVLAVHGGKGDKSDGDSSGG